MTTDKLIALLITGIGETLYMTVVSAAMAYVLGIPIGVLLFLTDKNKTVKSRFIGIILGNIVNLIRSVPFIILLVVLLPLTRLIVGTSVGASASIVPLVVAAAPLVGRMVESSLKEVDNGVIEAAEAMGSSTFQIIYKVLLPESLPSLITGATITITTILGYSAMAGFTGGGGLGTLAINYGYYKYDTLTMIIVVFFIVLIVLLFEQTGKYLVKRLDKRIKD